MTWRDKAVLQAEQDQDVANALKWWREASDSDKMKIWSIIQTPQENPVMEVSTRFAQIGMTHIALAALEEDAK